MEYGEFFKRFGERRLQYVVTGLAFGEWSDSKLTVETLARAIEDRIRSHDPWLKEPSNCQCPYPYKINKAGGMEWCKHIDGDKCTHPSNKPPEPECEHGWEPINGLGSKTGGIGVSVYRVKGDKHCRDCGEKL